MNDNNTLPLVKDAFVLVFAVSAFKDSAARIISRDQPGIAVLLQQAAFRGRNKSSPCEPFHIRKK